MRAETRQQRPRPLGVDLRERVVEEENGGAPALGLEDLGLCQPEGDGRGALLAERAVAPDRPAAQSELQVVPVRPDRRPAASLVERAPVQKKRSWQKSALIIGGSAASGAAVGGMVDGKKGALIGAALGGGAASIFEAVKR